LSLFVGVEGLRAVVFGHSHEPYNDVQRGVLLFNPGSPTERRRQPRPSYGFLTIEDGLVRGQIVYL
jgi:predicted phosphodiesterase